VEKNELGRREVANENEKAWRRRRRRRSKKRRKKEKNRWPLILLLVRIIMKDHRIVRKPRQHFYTFAALLTEVKMITGMFVNGRFVSCESSYPEPSYGNTVDSNL
jgi:hypothetical protein